MAGRAGRYGKLLSCLNVMNVIRAREGRKTEHRHRGDYRKHSHSAVLFCLRLICCRFYQPRKDRIAGAPTVLAQNYVPLPRVQR